ncbi:hypothetical protein GOP47_0023644 [Adiantum capillus-veneris]|uniref:Uncharacterized protein n=1 Tax=Adiantum capillus-veneris TaxID=13818 RepID=A0A9D4U625_ADICA|nr:hypothetical protein GOP47_0023644 [Adiantum capillus-veneris]
MLYLHFYSGKSRQPCFLVATVLHCRDCSPSFQRFAVRSSKAIEDASRKSAQKTQQLKEQLEDFVDYVKSEHFKDPSSKR